MCFWWNSFRKSFSDANGNRDSRPATFVFAGWKRHRPDCFQARRLHRFAFRCLGMVVDARRPILAVEVRVDLYQVRHLSQLSCYSYLSWWWWWWWRICLIKFMNIIISTYPSFIHQPKLLRFSLSKASGTAYLGAVARHKCRGCPRRQGKHPPVDYHCNGRNTIFIRRWHLQRLVVLEIVIFVFPWCSWPRKIMALSCFLPIFFVDWNGELNEHPPSWRDFWQRWKGTLYGGNTNRLKRF